MYLTTLSITWQWIINGEVPGRKHSWRHLVTIPAFAWREGERPRNPLLRIVWCSGWLSNRVHCEYKSEAFFTGWAKHARSGKPTRQCVTNLRYPWEQGTERIRNYQLTKQYPHHARTQSGKYLVIWKYSYNKCISKHLVVAYLVILFHYFPGKTEKNKKTHSG
jgi:hypothetical protein